MKTIETSRLILRGFMEKDLRDMKEYLQDPEVVAFEPYPPMSEEQVSETLQQRLHSEEMIAVELKQNGKLIGNLYFGVRECGNRELGYVFNRRFWRMGYAKQACAALITDTFSKGIHRIYAECDPKNISSWSLLESLGFRRQAYLKQNVYFETDEEGNPVWKDTYLYARLAEE